MGEAQPFLEGAQKVDEVLAGTNALGGLRPARRAGVAAIGRLIAYKKSKFDDLPTSFIAELKRAVEKSL